MHLLIIDDDKIDRHIVIDTFKDSNFRITQAATGKEGIALAVENEYDVILLDYLLPDIDGIEVLKEINHSSKGQATVIMLSGEENESLACKAIDEGAQDFFLKSEINTNRLHRSIQQATHRHHLEKQLKKNHRQLKKLAEHDPLTGLSNRYDFERALSLATKRKNRGSKVALLLLDIDKFKGVNDTFGHAVGDQLLIEVAKRLSIVARSSDLVARLAGDEFVILMQDFEKDEYAILLANRIIKNFAEPIQLNNTKWPVTTSIGISVLGDCAHTADELLKCADIAMYRAKKEGRNQSHFYSKELHDRVRKRTQLEVDIRHAINDDQFIIYYQAQVDCTNNKLYGIEALIRWQHPKLGIIPPDQFLPIAEELGMMNEIGLWVLITACNQMKEWKNQYPQLTAQLAVAVNLSAIQLHGDTLITQIDNVIKQTNIEATSIELEITENDLIKNPNHVAHVLKSISDKGVLIALDDFGTGYSSFEHLKLFPIDRFKIDRNFISDIGKNEKMDLLLAAMINFGTTLGLTVIAEGVETTEQAEFCETMGCFLLQGYLFSIPCKASEFEQQFMISNEFLKKNKHKSV